MKNRNLQAITAVVGIFVALSLVTGIFFAARNTSGEIDSEIYTSSQNSGEISSQSENTLGSSQQSQTSSSESSASKESQSASQTNQGAVSSQTNQNGSNDVQPVSTDGYKAMWISYLEFESVDFSTQDSFTKAVETMFKNCADMGLNTVIVQVRPFGDALYNSSVFPASHLMTGTQGVMPSYDPLAVMVEKAHSLNLRIEAWINPYRVKLSSTKPGNLAANNPANDPSLVFNANGGIYYNPALTQVQDLVVSGIEEIVRNYNVDGIHLDDYFYPTTDLSIDKSYYDASGTSLSQADWRRENVNTLVRKIYDKIKSIKPSVTFGISPQGNNDNNYNTQYSDVNLWLSQKGYVDYIMPQLYWGFGYLTASGRDDYQFVKLANQWASYPRDSSVKLYLGLGAYRIGAGDGGSNDQSEWSSGNNLMKQVNALYAVNGISGFALYRYDNLFRNSAYAALAQSEAEHLRDIL